MREDVMADSIDDEIQQEIKAHKILCHRFWISRDGLVPGKFMVLG